MKQYLHFCHAKITLGEITRIFNSATMFNEVYINYYGYQIKR